VDEYRAIKRISTQEDFPQTKEEAKKLLVYLAESFEEEDRAGLLIKDIDKIKLLFLQRKDAEAFSLLRNIRLKKIELATTKEQMIWSVGETAAFKSGIPDFDNNMGGFLAGNVMALTGDTGTMKTTLALWIMLETLIKNPDFTGVFFEKEMHVSDLARKLVSKMMRRTTKELMQGIIDGYATSIASTVTNKYDEYNLKDALDRLILIPNNRFHDTNDMHRIIAQYDANIWCLDFMTQIVMDSSSLNEAVAKAANNLKNIVADTGSFGIVINQSRKMEGNRRDKRVTENDAEWSGTVKQIAAYHVGIFYPYKYYGQWQLKGVELQQTWIYLMFLKTRHDATGLIVPLLANPAMSEFYSPNDEEKAQMLFWYNEYIKI